MHLWCAPSKVSYSSALLMSSWLAHVQSCVCSSRWTGQLSCLWGELYLSYLIRNCFLSISLLLYSSLIHSPSGWRRKFEGQPPVKLIFNIHGTSVIDYSFNESSFASEWVRRSSGFLIIPFINRTRQMRNGVPFIHLIMPRTIKLVSFPLALAPIHRFWISHPCKPGIVVNIPKRCNHTPSLCCCWKNNLDPLTWSIPQSGCRRNSNAMDNFLFFPDLSSFPPHRCPVAWAPAFFPPHRGCDNARWGEEPISTTQQAQMILFPWLFVTIASCMKYVVFSLIDTSGGHSSQQCSLQHSILKSVTQSLTCVFFVKQTSCWIRSTNPRDDTAPHSAEIQHIIKTQ